ncbi:hypothetical protein [Nonomuraea sp. NPDC049750]|uniref:hypothetical protein n=1 Tax=Nonomuraea sp. NPDC049750 TaxID=3154738 RepID=UPI00340F5045
MRRVTGVTAAVAVAAGLITTSPASASSSAPSETTTATNASQVAAREKSHKCDKPKGKRFNISWSPGMESTTFYFNNHCREKNRIKVWTTDSVTHVTSCTNIGVKPGVKGKKKVWGAIKGNIDMVTFGTCPW